MTPPTVSRDGPWLLIDGLHGGPHGIGSGRTARGGGVISHAEDEWAAKKTVVDLRIVADAFSGEAYNTLCEMLKNGYRLELVGTPNTPEIEGI